MNGFREFFNYQDLISDLGDAGAEDIGGIHEFQINPAGRKKILIVGGVHGDEESGPRGVVAYARGKPDPKNHLIFIPCANAHGFNKGVRTNADRRDINRHFHPKKQTKESEAVWKRVLKHEPDFVVSLHEVDYKTAFVYCQSSGKKCDLLPLAKKLVGEIQKEFPVHKGKLNDGPFKNRCSGSINGVVSCKQTSLNTLEDQLLKEGIPSLTTELPSGASRAKKIEVTVKMLEVIGQW